VILLDLLWWLGLAWFAAWTALPLMAIPALGVVPGVVVWALLAPWSALLGMAVLHRTLPACVPGRFRLFDSGSVRWALKSWAPSVYLAVFQSLCFQSEAFQRLVLRAFGARVGRGALVTSRTILREPHLLSVGQQALIAEFAHLVCSYQPRPGVLVVAPIRIGEHAFVGAHALIAPGADIGARVMLEYGVGIGAHCVIGADTRIGAESTVYNSVRIGRGVVIGKGCRIPTGSVIPDGLIIDDGSCYEPVPREREAVA
jgi:acetyltransferase-like isoleucine patch superfamily enzyme